MRTRGRRAGLMAPLFSTASRRSWGIGEIADIEPMTGWLTEAGLRVLQLLPINEMSRGETSPYSAMSAMAIDPIYISLGDLEDFAALGGEEGLEPPLRQRLEQARAAERIDYRSIRDLKAMALRRSFERFRDLELPAQTLRAFSFDVYRAQEEWWLGDYALFRALHARYDGRPWTEWPEPLRVREPSALDAARADLADQVLYREYLQWVAGEQWARARTRADRVALFGDLPFMVSLDSADVWARQDEFRLDASVGVPPDAFSADGQDWKLPLFRWDVMMRSNLAWLRARARRYATLFDGYRVDHLVGFYRTYFRPHDGSPARFTPDDEPSQIAQGERALAVFLESGAEIVAEDLGVVPDFVRASLARLSVPGCKVFRWERQWRVPGQPFVDPAEYPVASVATSGTHDTEPMVAWWEAISVEERREALGIPFVKSRLSQEERARATVSPVMPDPVRAALVEALFAAASTLLVLPVQDAFGWRDRINRPAIVSDENWTWRLPWPVDRLSSQPETRAVASALEKWSSRHGRS